MNSERSKKLFELLAELEQSPEAQRLDREWGERMPELKRAVAAIRERMNK